MVELTRRCQVLPGAARCCQADEYLLLGNWVPRAFQDLGRAMAAVLGRSSTAASLPDDHAHDARCVGTMK